MSIQHESEYKNIRKALDRAFAHQSACQIDFGRPRTEWSFCQNLNEYTWRYIEKKDILVPYSHVTEVCDEAEEHAQSAYLNPKEVHWERHCVWIVEGVLVRGESNIFARRRFYFDEQSWLILMGEGFAHSGELTGYYMLCHTMAQEKPYRGRWYRVS